MPVNSKPWWQSRVLWLNIISAIVIVLEVKYEALKPLVSPELYKSLALLIPIANAVLRVITTAQLTFGAGKSE